ncbi:expressed unknown protein [Seminavis robusta]|uniref:Uncharacterized protein n=1 Tax=Seminavis robusta TaxID=568900 RepID=A0A9N8HIJ9_9STRA|nr:expressed unknown protein [Seminavis robusta]|eukprot:Sro505_g156170.1 n/a (503) ;mRNA; r:38655-40219
MHIYNETRSPAPCRYFASPDDNDTYSVNSSPPPLPPPQDPPLPQDQAASTTAGQASMSSSADSPFGSPDPDPLLASYYSGTTGTSTATASTTAINSQSYAHYTPAYEEESEDSLLQNIARVAVSVARPPSFQKAVPKKQVARAISKLLNVTSALRSHELLAHLLDQYDYSEQPSSAALAQQLLERFPTNEIPNIIPTDQALVFFTRYTPTFQRQRQDHAFFWELVQKPANPIPIHRFSSTSTTIINSTTMPKSTATTTTTTHTADPPLARWYLHPIYYRCYTRDQDGTIIPMEDPQTLQLIEEQMHQWVNFHIQVTNELLQKLQGDQAIAVAMPGEEQDLILQGGNWIHRPFPPPHLDSSNNSDRPGNSSCSTRPGTYNAPLETTPNNKRTTSATVGLVVLCSTIGFTILWLLAAMIHGRQRVEQEIWSANVGTEQALQDLLSIGWQLHDQHDVGKEPVQVLIIYDKTEHGMEVEYSKEGSLRAGGLEPPVFPTITVEDQDL